jgi:TRAP-type C4-dicarboxylate transport system substrate-binding protein
MKKGLSIITSVLILSILSLASWGTSAIAASEGQKVYVWRGQSLYGTNSGSWDVWKYLKEAIEFNTGGRVKLELYPAGQLSKVRETFDAVSKGLIDVELGCLVYESGKVPEADVSWLPYAWENPQQAMFMYEYGGIIPLLRKALQKNNMYYLCPSTAGSYGFMTKFPINRVEDLKGKKIHSSGMAAKVIQAMGATAVPLPSVEVYTALQRGTVDGTCWPYYTIETYKFHEVVSYMTFPPIYTPTIWDVMINLDKWKELPDDLKAKVNRAGSQVMMFSAEISVLSNMGVYNAAKKFGVKMHTLPTEEVEKIKKAVMPLWDKTAARSETNKQIIKILKDFVPKTRPLPY